MAIDKKAFYNIGYGLYVVSCKDGQKHNAMICNTVCQVSNEHFSVSINKNNFSCGMIAKTGVLNVNCLTEKAPFELFERLGFKSGKDLDKMRYEVLYPMENGVMAFANYVNAVISLKVENVIDLNSHLTFICKATESKVICSEPSMTYAYYHANVKPKPKKTQAKGYRCKICGYVYEGSCLPQDFTCPWCKHPASDFESME